MWAQFKCQEKVLLLNLPTKSGFKKVWIFLENSENVFQAESFFFHCKRLHKHPHEIFCGSLKCEWAGLWCIGVDFCVAQSVYASLQICFKRSLWLPSFPVVLSVQLVFWEVQSNPCYYKLAFVKQNQRKKKFAVPRRLKELHCCTIRRNQLENKRFKLGGEGWKKINLS